MVINIGREILALPFNIFPEQLQLVNIRNFYLSPKLVFRPGRIIRYQESQI